MNRTVIALSFALGMLAIDTGSAAEAGKNVYFRNGKVIPAPVNLDRKLTKMDAGGIDCVKIACPKSFKPGTVCWECH